MTTTTATATTSNHNPQQPMTATHDIQQMQWQATANMRTREHNP